MMTKAEVIEGALALPVEDRLEIIHVIDESLELDRPAFSLSTEWRAEIERRIDELDTGKVQTIPGEVVFAEIRDRLEQLRRDKSSV